MTSNPTSSKLLDGRLALVTGAAAGIGRAIALHYAQAGASVILVDLRAERGDRRIEAPDHVRVLDYHPAVLRGPIRYDLAMRQTGRNEQARGHDERDRPAENPVVALHAPRLTEIMQAATISARRIHAAASCVASSGANR